MKKNDLEKFYNLLDALNSLPSIGKKSALKFAYHLVLEDKYLALKLAHSIESAVMSTKKCKFCGNITENEICYTRDDETKDKRKLCIVESEKDILTIEENTTYDGLFFVLNSIDKEDIDRLKEIVILFSKIAQGVPTGVNLENVDMMSLSRAIESRVKV